MPSPLIDTVRLSVAVNHQLWLNRQIEDFRAGRRNAVTKALASNFRRFSIEGAYGSKATVQSARSATVLFIECSLPRFLTGQNVFGSIQILAQVYKVVTAVLQKLGIEPTAEEAAAIAEGRIGLNRLDFTLHARLKNYARIRLILQALKGVLAFTTKDFSCYGDETLYIGQHSKHRSLKLYNKALQLTANPLAAELPERQRVLEAAKGLLRIEMVLHKKGLQARNWHEVRLFDGKAAFAILLKQIALLDTLTADVETHYCEYVHELSSLQNALLAAHHRGADARDLLPTPRSFNRHRSAIKNATGVDLAIPAAVSDRVATIGVPTLRPHLVRKKSESERALASALGF